jgi:glycosyltransferase involved in cell wall biosynthesis
MAVGIPVVGRRMGSNAEIIQDGINGFLVDGHDEWHDKLSLLISNSDLRRRMGKAARKTVEDKFSLQTQMPRLVRVFDNVKTHFNVSSSF